MALYALSTEADRNPAHPDLQAINSYLEPSIVKQWDSLWPALVKEHQAYRGTTPDPHLKVASVSSHGAVLTACLLASKSDPYVQVDARTGVPATIPTRSVPGPYPQSIFMSLRDGKWRLSALTTDGTRTCTHS